MAVKRKNKKKYISHLKGDIRGYKDEIKDDKQLIKKLHKNTASPSKVKKHLTSDMEYHGKEIAKDKKLRTKAKKTKKKAKKSKGMGLLIAIGLKPKKKKTKKK